MLNLYLHLDGDRAIAREYDDNDVLMVAVNTVVALVTVIVRIVHLQKASLISASEAVLGSTCLIRLFCKLSCIVSVLPRPAASTKSTPPA